MAWHGQCKATAHSHHTKACSGTEHAAAPQPAPHMLAHAPQVVQPLLQVKLQRGQRGGHQASQPCWTVRRTRSCCRAWQNSPFCAQQRQPYQAAAPPQHTACLQQAAVVQARLQQPQRAHVPPPQLFQLQRKSADYHAKIQQFHVPPAMPMPMPAPCHAMPCLPPCPQHPPPPPPLPILRSSGPCPCAPAAPCAAGARPRRTRPTAAPPSAAACRPAARLRRDKGGRGVVGWVRHRKVDCCTAARRQQQRGQPQPPNSWLAQQVDACCADAGSAKQASMPNGSEPSATVRHRKQARTRQHVPAAQHKVSTLKAAQAPLRHAGRQPAHQLQNAAGQLCGYGPAQWAVRAWRVGVSARMPRCSELISTAAAQYCRSPCSSADESSP